MHVLGAQHEAEIDADHAARGGEGVDLLGVDQHDAQRRVAQFAVLGQMRQLGFDVILEDGVIDGRHGRQHPLEELLAELALHFRGDQPGGPIPKGRQVIAGRRRSQGMAGQGGGEKDCPQALHGREYKPAPSVRYCAPCPMRPSLSMPGA